MSDAHFSAYGFGRMPKTGWEESVSGASDQGNRKLEEIIELDSELGRDIQHALALAQRGADPFAFVSPPYKRDEIINKIRARYPWICDYLFQESKRKSM